MEDDDDDDGEVIEEAVQEPVDGGQVEDIGLRDEVECDDDEESDEDLHGFGTADEHKDLVEEVPDDDEIDGIADDIRRRHIFEEGEKVIKHEAGPGFARLREREERGKADGRGRAERQR